MFRRTAIAIVTTIVLLSTILNSPIVRANPDKPAVIVAVPPKASHDQILARVRKATIGLNGWAKIELKTDSTITTTIQLASPAAASIAATPTITTSLGWNRPAVSDYPRATAQDLSPTLTYCIYGGSAEVEAFSWIEYYRLGNLDSETYTDFDYYRGIVSGCGALTINLPTFVARTGFRQVARFDAVARFDGDPYNILSTASAVFSMGQTYLPEVVR